MPAPYLSLIDALDRVRRGLSVPVTKYAALQRRGFIRVLGHGKKARPFLTGTGYQALARQDEVCG